MSYTTLIENELSLPWIKTLVEKLSGYPYLAELVLIVIFGGIGFLIASVLNLLLQRLLQKRFAAYAQSDRQVAKYIRQIVFYFVCIFPALGIVNGLGNHGCHEWLSNLSGKCAHIVVVILIALMLSRGIKLFGLWYRQQNNAAHRPIDGILQLIQFFVWAAAAIILIAGMLNKSPLYLLSGLGAMAAVLMLVFQQTILSFVASVQVNTNHLVNLGDWIVMDSHNIDGIVEEITLHTFKVRNWDMSLVTVPVCDLVNDSFINYTAMQQAGGRRIKRAILIDQRSIRFLTKEEIEALKGFDLLKDYLAGKESEITQYNASRSTFNTRHLTNLGTFRAYVQCYLEHNPNIRQDMTVIARELAPSSSGYPLEVYCFCKETSMPRYERVQADIFEHLLAVLPSFRLRVFQDCSDIYQEVGSVPDVIGSAFRFEQYKNPVYPDNQ